MPPDFPLSERGAVALPDEEGDMNVLIISTNRHVHPVPVMPLGAAIAAEAAEKAGYRVRVLDLMFERNHLLSVEKVISDLKPDVIGISIRNIDNNDLRNPVFFPDAVTPLMDVIRKKTDARVILGGAAVGVMPEQLMRHTGISLAVTGDGGIVFPELLGKLDNGGDFTAVPGIARLDDGVFSMNPRPAASNRQCTTPDIGRWTRIDRYLSSLSTLPIQTKLGCQFRCTYCTYRRIEGPEYRLFEVESVASAMERLASSGLKDFEFVDNVFNAPYRHAVRMCERLARGKETFRLYSLELNPLYVDDALLTEMGKAGFRGIGITVESASDNVLEGLGKGYTSFEVHRSAEVVSRHNMPCVWIFMLGGPGETKETVKETMRFAVRHIKRRDTVFFNIGVRVYPGTELDRIARDQGVLSVPQSEMLRPVFYVSPGIDPSSEKAVDWIEREVASSMESHMNFIDSRSIGLSFLPAIHRLGYRLGIRSPLWKYTPFIRRGLRCLGVNA